MKIEKLKNKFFDSFNISEFFKIFKIFEKLCSSLVSLTNIEEIQIEKYGASSLK